MNQVVNIIKYILPYLVAAGNYSSEIQKRIIYNSSKSKGGNIFEDALTDADLSVQSFLEVILLARYPEISFWGEEYLSSLNQKYFTSKSELKILVDPIDGTKFYKDGCKNYSIILSIINQEQFLAAISYFPRLGVGYLAIKDSGTYILSKEDLLNSVWTKKVNLDKTSKLIRSFNQKILSEKVRKFLPVIDIVYDYDISKVGMSINDIFHSNLGGFFYYENGQVYDAGAYAFMVSEANGVVSDINGNNLEKISETINLNYKSLVVTSHTELHEILLKALNN